MITPRKDKRLEKKETRLVAKGYKAVDEGREKKADRLLRKAANIQDRRIKVNAVGKAAAREALEDAMQESLIKGRRMMPGPKLPKLKSELKAVYKNESRPISMTEEDIKTNYYKK